MYVEVTKMYWLFIKKLKWTSFLESW